MDPKDREEPGFLEEEESSKPFFMGESVTVERRLWRKVLSFLEESGFLGGSLAGAAPPEGVAGFMA